MPRTEHRPAKYFGGLIMKIHRVLELEAALRFVQTALANWRDEEKIIHPEYGELNLEEVKYLIVDVVLED